MTATHSRATLTAAEALGRNAARLAAVQAIYQIDITGADLNEVMKDFLAGRLGGVSVTVDPDTEQETAVTLPEADSGLFTTLVRAAHERAEDIDGMIRAAVTADWPYERLEMILRSILRAGVAELLVCMDVPPRVTVSEYIDIAHAFYAGVEPRMVNAVLDRIARSLGRLEERNA